jgi:DNA-binding IclR family transcriptional regulator
MGIFHTVDAMSDQVPERLAADAAILATFRSEPVQYPALIASRSGLHIPSAERRCRALADRGLLEQVSDEIAYRLTADGQHYLSRTASESDSPP